MYIKIGKIIKLTLTSVSALWR